MNDNNATKTDSNATRTDSNAIPRREFLKAAVAIGGLTAFSACLGREPEDIPTGPSDLSSYPRRQHAWNTVLPSDEYGNPVPPRHRVLLYLNYEKDGRPSTADRETVETALRGVEHAYERTGDGLLLTMSYSPTYFERFDESLPGRIDLPGPEALAPFEDPQLDTPDAVIHLASNHATVVLGTEEALKGNRASLNGVDLLEAGFMDVFRVADRRTGFVGDGLPANHDNVEGVPEGAVSEDAPLFMGFKSGFTKNQASEARVTIRSGPFAGGTTQHISTLRLNLHQWYEQDSRWQRVAKMFCPYHAKNGVVDGTGKNLGTSSNIDTCRSSQEAAREMGVVGHSQKTARAREDDQPIILRRDADSTDGGHAGLHFLALQRRIDDFVTTRQAMNGIDLTETSAVGQRNNNGILQYIRTEHRGNFLVPPRSLRALPPALPMENEARDEDNEVR